LFSSDGQGSRTQTVLTNDSMSPLFDAVLEATEEAIYNSMLKATDTTSRNITTFALPIDQLKAVLAKYNR
jgi:D-aminopeptidase